MGTHLPSGQALSFFLPPALPSGVCFSSFPELDRVIPNSFPRSFFKDLTIRALSLSLYGVVFTEHDFHKFENPNHAYHQFFHFLDTLFRHTTPPFLPLHSLLTVHHIFMNCYGRHCRNELDPHALSIPPFFWIPPPFSISVNLTPLHFRIPELSYPSLEISSPRPYRAHLFSLPMTYSHTCLSFSAILQF